MRNDFINELVNVAEKDERVVLLTADLGFHVVEAFYERFPDRFINVGVAEQNMIALATGLAREGFLPFVYSIAPFTVVRNLEFIKNGPVGHDLQVRIVGVGAGVAYAHLGLSHFLIEDFASLGDYDNIEIYVPIDRRQAVSILRNTYLRKGPVYYRLDKNNKAEISWTNPLEIEIGYSGYRSNCEIAILATGGVANEVDIARVKLQERGIIVDVGLVYRINPFPCDAVVRAISRASIVVTVEDHGPIGGLADRVRRLVVEHRLTPKFYSLSLSLESVVGQIATQGELYRRASIDSDSIVEICLESLHEK